MRFINLATGKDSLEVIVSLNDFVKEGSQTFPILEDNRLDDRSLAAIMSDLDEIIFSYSVKGADFTLISGSKRQAAYALEILQGREKLIFARVEDYIDKNALSSAGMTVPIYHRAVTIAMMFGDPEIPVSLEKVFDSYIAYKNARGLRPEITFKQFRRGIAYSIISDRNRFSELWYGKGLDIDNGKLTIKNSGSLEEVGIDGRSVQLVPSWYYLSRDQKIEALKQAFTGNDISMRPYVPEFPMPWKKGVSAVNADYPFLCAHYARCVYLSYSDLISPKMQHQEGYYRFDRASPEHLMPIYEVKIFFGKQERQDSIAKYLEALDGYSDDRQAEILNAMDHAGHIVNAAHLGGPRDDPSSWYFFDMRVEEGIPGFDLFADQGYLHKVPGNFYIIKRPHELSFDNTIHWAKLTEDTVIQAFMIAADGRPVSFNSLDSMGLLPLLDMLTRSSPEHIEGMYDSEGSYRKKMLIEEYIEKAL